MKVAFKNFGCRANSVDVDILWQEALRRGFDVVAESEVADFYIINSCTVTEAADKDARAAARRYKALNPNAKVGVIGCYAQAASNEIQKNPSVDFILGTADKLKALDYLNSSPQLFPKTVAEASGFLPENFLGSLRARPALKVQDGCNFKCSFCIIPQARGRSVSLPLQAVLRQYRQARDLGYNEVVLTGIHLAHYGWDRNSSLFELVKVLLREPGPRIRLSTLDPFELPDELIHLMRSEEKLCPYVHIALQSGSDSVLKAMRRIYKAQEFVDVAEKLKNIGRDVFIGVDVIVGFPTESAEDFEQTISVLKSSYWSKLHVFPYSVRKNTEAANFEGRVPERIIFERSARARVLSSEREHQFVASQIGKTGRVVLEKRVKKSEDLWIGHSENFIPVIFAGAARSGELKTLLFEAAGEPRYLFGRQVGPTESVPVNYQYYSYKSVSELQI